MRVQGGWQNRALVRMAAEFTTYNPIRSVSRVAAPVLLVAATNDSLCPYELVEKAAALNPKVPPRLPAVPALLQVRADCCFRILGRYTTCQQPVTYRAGTSLCSALPLQSCRLPEAGCVTCTCVQVQVVSRGVGHFDVYMGAAFDDVVEEQLAFLQVRRHPLCLAQQVLLSPPQ